MVDENRESLPASTRPETFVDIIAAISSIVPWIGGPVSIVLGGVSLSWKMRRVSEVLENMAQELHNFESDASKTYVGTEDFQELLERTLRQVEYERSSAKRRVYAAFLAGVVKSPGEPYDEQIRYLRTIEEMQPDHIRIIKAILQPPDPNPPFTGSRGQTLARRLPDMPESRVIDLATQLNDMKVTTIGGLSGTMTGRGAEDFSGAFTPYGQRLLKYIQSAL